MPLASFDVGRLSDVPARTQKRPKAVLHHNGDELLNKLSHVGGALQ
jgi:hypothetical protein